MTDHDSREHDHELDALWNVLSNATNRDLVRRRKRIRRRAVVMSLAAAFVLVTSVAFAMPSSPIRNLFAPDVPAKQQILGLNQLGRPLGGDEDASIRRAYSFLKYNGNFPVSQIPPEKDARVLIDKGDEFKLIAVTTNGAKGGLCVAASIEERAETWSHGEKLGGISANCQGQIIFEQPFTSGMTLSRDKVSWIAFGIVADGVRDITFRTTQRTFKVAVENKAYYWKSRPHELVVEMSARRPDGSLYRFKLPPGSFDASDPNDK